MAYEMLTGTVPFEGENVLELLYAHVHRQPPPASSRRKDLGLDVDAVLERGLLKDPEKRWETSAAFAEALATALEPRPVRAAPVPAVAASMVPRRRRTPLLAAIAALLIVALVIGAVAFVRDRGEPVAGSLSPMTAQGGDTVVVSARNLPAGQNGVVRALTPARDLGSFHANRQGQVEQGVVIPGDEPAGDHIVQLCWSGSCHDLATVKVTR